tara:strand:+ start:477 stop:722 length:246 start_codon:yes stop_codon:yes gene_type:complete
MSNNEMRLYKITENINVDVHYEIQATNDDAAFDIYLEGTHHHKVPVKIDSSIDKVYLGKDHSQYEGTEDITPNNWEESEEI